MWLDGRSASSIGKSIGNLPVSLTILANLYKIILQDRTGGTINWLYVRIVQNCRSETAKAASYTTFNVLLSYIFKVCDKQRDKVHTYRGGNAPLSLSAPVSQLIEIGETHSDHRYAEIIYYPLIISISD